MISRKPLVEVVGLEIKVISLHVVNVNYLFIATKNVKNSTGKKVDINKNVNKLYKKNSNWKI